MAFYASFGQSVQVTNSSFVFHLPSVDWSVYHFINPAVLTVNLGVLVLDTLATLMANPAVLGAPLVILRVNMAVPTMDSTLAFPITLAVIASVVRNILVTLAINLIPSELDVQW